MGLLTVKGTIELSQLWPQGKSDADTTKVLVNVTPDAFVYRPHPGGPTIKTHAFHDSVVIGLTRKSPIDKKGRITIRLQGIDAPELHYRPSPLRDKKGVAQSKLNKLKTLNKEYRQHFGETATVALGTLLQKTGQSPVPCEVTTLVDRPTDVFDTYGRFVGDIWVHIEQKRVNVNHWLVEQGWAYPAFYNSMQKDEMLAFIAAAKKGRKPPRVWRHLQKSVGTLDSSLVYRNHGEPDPVADKGPVLLPKLFRRLCTWSCYKKAGIETKTFIRYLTEQKKPDICYLTKEFLETDAYSAMPHRLADFVTPGGKVLFSPDDLVFKEQASKLIGPDGKEVLEW